MNCFITLHHWAQYTDWWQIKAGPKNSSGCPWKSQWAFIHEVPSCIIQVLIQNSNQRGIWNWRSALGHCYATFPFLLFLAIGVPHGEKPNVRSAVSPWDASIPAQDLFNSWSKLNRWSSLSLTLALTDCESMSTELAQGITWTSAKLWSLARLILG